jgi:hypothetical protein
MRPLKRAQGDKPLSVFPLDLFSRDSDPNYKRNNEVRFHVLRAKQGNQTFLRSAAPGARKAMEKAPCSSR